MKKYIYEGNEERVYIDESGVRHNLYKGATLESKIKPDWEDIVEVKNKSSKKDDEVKSNDSSK